jgi:hypothetical protein
LRLRAIQHFGAYRFHFRAEKPNHPAEALREKISQLRFKPGACRIERVAAKPFQKLFLGQPLFVNLRAKDCVKHFPHGYELTAENLKRLPDRRNVCDIKRNRFASRCRLAIIVAVCRRNLDAHHIANAHRRGHSQRQPPRAALIVANLNHAKTSGGISPQPLPRQLCFNREGCHAVERIGFGNAGNHRIE